MSEQLKKTAITRKNKEGQEYTVGQYVMVNERIRAFRSAPEFAGYRIVTTRRQGDSTEHIVFGAEILNPEGHVVATGHAEEFRTNNPTVNKFSAIMNAETSSIGRALGFLGIGIADGIASSEEVTNNIEKVYDFCMEGLRMKTEQSMSYAKLRLGDTNFTGEQRRNILKAINDAKVAASSVTTTKNQNNV